LGNEPVADDEGFMVGQLNGVSFVIGLIIAFFGTCFFVFILIRNIMGVRLITLPELPKWLGGYDGVNKVLTSFFKWWGTGNYNYFHLFTYLKAKS